MNSWLSPDTTTVTQQLLVDEISKKLAILQSNKVSPIEEDFMFKDFYSGCELTAHSERPLLSVIHDDSSICKHECETHFKYTGPSDSSVVLMSNLENDEASNVLSAVKPVLDSTSTISLIRPRGIKSVFSNMNVLLLPASSVLAELASVSHTILLVIDCTEPDLSRPMRLAVDRLRKHGSRMRILLVTPSSSDDSQSSLPIIWSLSKLLTVQEMPRVFFTHDTKSLHSDISQMSLLSTTERVWRVQREAKLARSHAALLSYMKSQLPAFNKQGKQEKLIADISNVIRAASDEFGIPVAEFPAVDFLKERLGRVDFAQIKKLKESSLKLVSECIETDIPGILRILPTGFVTSTTLHANSTSDDEYVPDFESLSPVDGLIAGPSVREHLETIAKCSSGTLFKIWKLADMDKDGKLTFSEYCVCRRLIQLVKAGGDLPRQVPAEWLRR